MPFSVCVKDRMMYSHTFTFDDGVPFTTGCTAVVTATFEGAALGPYDILIDILVAQRLLREVMELYDHKNLDALQEFARPDGSRRNTTVEVMAQAVYRQLHSRLQALSLSLSLSVSLSLSLSSRILPFAARTHRSLPACAPAQAHHHSVLATDGKGLGAVTARTPPTPAAACAPPQTFASHLQAMHIKLEESDVALASYWEEARPEGLFSARAVGS